MTIFEFLRTPTSSIPGWEDVFLPINENAKEFFQIGYSERGIIERIASILGFVEDFDLDLFTTEDLDAILVENDIYVKFVDFE